MEEYSIDQRLLDDPFINPSIVSCMRYTLLINFGLEGVRSKVDRCHKWNRKQGLKNFLQSPQVSSSSAPKAARSRIQKHHHYQCVRAARSRTEKRLYPYA